MVRKKSSIKKQVNRLCELLDKEGFNVERVILFGSYARNKGSEDSDIDLVVISSDFEKLEPLERLEFLSIISWNLPLPFEILGYTPNEIEKAKGKSVFWDEISKTGKVIYKAA